MNPHRINLHKVLLDSKILTKSRLEQALSIASAQDIPLFNVLIKQNYVTEEDLLKVISTVLNIPFEIIDRATVDPEVGLLISESFAKERSVLPLFQIGEMLSVAINNPFDIQTLEEIELITKLNISPVLTLKNNLIPLIEYCYTYQSPDSEKDDSVLTNLFERGVKLVEDRQISEEEALDISQEAPIAKLVDN
ncbi:hypothetical protein ACFLZV_05545, partial [Candidatus Margulisiibacteriota bacterium]